MIVIWKNWSKSVSHFHFSVECSGKMLFGTERSKGILMSARWRIVVISIWVQRMCFPVCFYDWAGIWKCIWLIEISWRNRCFPTILKSICIVHVFSIPIKTLFEWILVFCLFNDFLLMPRSISHYHLSCPNSRQISSWWSHLQWIIIQIIYNLSKCGRSWHFL